MQHVTDDGHTQVVEFLLVVADREHVQQRLRGMGMAPVAGVDNVDLRRDMARDEMRRATLRVAHHEHVGMHRA